MSLEQHHAVEEISERPSKEEETSVVSLLSSCIYRDDDSPIGTGIWCENLSYTVKKKKVIHAINFCAKPGELTVIMGPSGSGKTSLLNALLHRLTSGQITGTRGLNSQEATKSNVRDVCHYVMSYDMALSYLTVRETIEFTARLRMPGSSRDEQLRAVNSVIEVLELTDCQHVRIGGEWRKGISKGQLKRVVIAQELLGDPDVLLLDEPTTGLDSNLSNEIISILKRVAQQTNKTIVACIHQPSQKAFELFDRLVLLSNGHLIYHGPAHEAVSFMISTGRKCSASSSPPDFLLEIATDVDYVGSCYLRSWSKADTVSDVSASFRPDLLEDLNKVVQTRRLNLPSYSTSDQLSELERTYQKSVYFLDLREDIQRLSQIPLQSKKYNQKGKWCEEFCVLWKVIHHFSALCVYILMQRCSLNSLRNPMTSTIILLVNIIQALVLGALFFQLQDESSEITTAAMSDWSIWQTPIFQFLAEGIDKQGFNPLSDVMARGVDGGGSQVLLDILINPEISDYLFEFVKCTRELSDIRRYPYPEHRWPTGSISGTVTTRSLAPLSRVGSRPAPQWPSKSLEDIISVIVEVTQILDFAIKTYDNFDLFVDPASSDYIKWLQISAKAFPVVAPIPCCLGMDRPFNISTFKLCSDEYPSYKFQKMPDLPSYAILGGVVASTRDLLEHFKPIAIEPLRVNPKSFAHGRRPGKRRRLGSSLGGLASDLWSLVANNADSPLSQVIQSLRSIKLQIESCQTATCSFFQSGIRSGEKVIKDITASVLTVLNFAGAIFFCVANLGFASYDCLLAFPKDRAIFNRENANGMYGGSSFFLGRTLADIPFQLVPCLVWSLIYYWMVGYTANASQFFAFLFICVLVSFCAYSFGYCVSAFSPRLEVAVVIAPLLLVIMLVLAGFFLRDPQIPSWIAWFKYVSIYRWGFFGMCAAQFPPGRSFGALDNNLILLLLGVTETRWEMSVIALIGLSLGFRLLSYLGLVFCNRSQGLEA